MAEQACALLTTQGACEANSCTCAWNTTACVYELSGSLHCSAWGLAALITGLILLLCFGPLILCYCFKASCRTAAECACCLCEDAYRVCCFCCHRGRASRHYGRTEVELKSPYQELNP